MRKLLFLLIFLLILPPAYAWKEGYSYRRKITIESDNVSGDETDFPVLVSYTHSDFRGDDEPGGLLTDNTNGYDFIFTDTNQLADF